MIPRLLELGCGRSGDSRYELHGEYSLTRLVGGLDRISHENILDYTAQIVRSATDCVAQIRCVLEANVWCVDRRY